MRSENGNFQEVAVPDQLPSHSVVALHAYGNAFFAAVYTLEAALPAPKVPTIPLSSSVYADANL